MEAGESDGKRGEMGPGRVASAPPPPIRYVTQNEKSEDVFLIMRPPITILKTD